MIIGIPVYDNVDLLDVTGPHEVLKWADPLFDVRLIAEKAGNVTSRDGLTFIARDTFENAPTVDVLWVPGGDPRALKELMNGRSRTYLDFLVHCSLTSRYVCSVCEGALLLAAAELLDGYEATTHWAFIPCLRKFPKIKVSNGYLRFVLDRNRLTGGGISSGLDEALKLVKLLVSYESAQNVQRLIQYYPDPPVQSALPAADVCPFVW